MSEENKVDPAQNKMSNAISQRQSKFFPYLSLIDTINKNYPDPAAMSESPYSKEDLKTLKILEIAPLNQTMLHQNEWNLLEQSCNIIVTVQVRKNLAIIRVPLILFYVFCHVDNFKALERQGKMIGQYGIKLTDIFEEITAKVKAYKNLNSFDTETDHDQPVNIDDSGKKKKWFQLKSYQLTMSAEIMAESNRRCLKMVLDLLENQPKAITLIKAFIKLQKETKQKEAYSQAVERAYTTHMINSVVDLSQVQNIVVRPYVTMKKPGYQLNERRRDAKDQRKLAKVVEKLNTQVVQKQRKHKSLDKASKQFIDEMNKHLSQTCVDKYFSKRIKTALDKSVESGSSERMSRQSNICYVDEKTCLDRFRVIQDAYFEIQQRYKVHNTYSLNFEKLFPPVISDYIKIVENSLDQANLQQLKLQSEVIRRCKVKADAGARDELNLVEQTIKSRIQELSPAQGQMKDYIQPFENIQKVNENLKNCNEIIIESKVLSKFPLDQEYLRHSYVPCQIRMPTQTELQMLTFYFKQINQCWDLIEKECNKNENQERPICIGSPYFHGCNYRYTYYPFYYLKGKDNSNQFISSNSRNNCGVFNLLPTNKTQNSYKRSYYSYIDEVQNLCNVLMDSIVYNDRRVFASMISAFLGINIERITSSSYANHVHFPLTQVLTFLLFNRDMQNYDFLQIYDSFETMNNNQCPDQIPNVYEIINQNKGYLDKELANGSSLVFEIVYFEGTNPKILSHFSVVRADSQGKLYIKNPCEYAFPTPREDPRYTLNKYFLDLKNEVFTTPSTAFNAQLIKVRAYLCRRSKERISMINEKSFSSIHYCRNFITKFFSLYSLFDEKNLKEDMKKSPQQMFDIIQKLQSIKIINSISKWQASPDDAADMVRWKYQPHPEQVLSNPNYEILKDFMKSHKEKTEDQLKDQMMEQLKAMIPDDRNIYLTFDLAEKYYELGHCLVNNKGDEIYNKFNKLFLRVIRDVIESFCDPSSELNKQLFIDYGYNIIKLLPYNPKAKTAPRISNDILEWIHFTPKDERLPLEDFLMMYDENSKPQFDSISDKFIELYQLQTDSKLQILSKNSPFSYRKTTSSHYCLYSPMFHKFSLQSKTSCMYNKGCFENLVHEQIILNYKDKITKTYPLKNTDKLSKDKYVKDLAPMKPQKQKLLEQIKTMGFAYEVVFKYLDKMNRTASDYDRDSYSMRESDEIARGQDKSDIEYDSTYATPDKARNKMIQGSQAQSSDIISDKRIALFPQQNKLHVNPTLLLDVVSEDPNEDGDSQVLNELISDVIPGKDIVQKIVGASGAFSEESGDKSKHVEGQSAPEFLKFDSEKAIDK